MNKPDPTDNQRRFQRGHSSTAEQICHDKTSLVTASGWGYDSSGFLHKHFCRKGMREIQGNRNILDFTYGD